jgi:sugar lactone lactonase YvrE
VADPNGLVVDGNGNLYIADAANCRVRKVDAATGIITTVAGNGNCGSGGDGGPATSAAVGSPKGLAFDMAGNLYIVERYNGNPLFAVVSQIRRVDAITGIITTVAGNGSAEGGPLGDGGLAINANIGAWSIAVDGSGNLYIGDTDYSRIRKVDAGTGIITTIAGNGTFGFSGDGGPATSAELQNPYGVTLDASGNLYIGDAGNARIRRVDARTGIITTIAGNGTNGSSGDGGAATNAEFRYPEFVALDASGNIYISDVVDNRIRGVFFGSNPLLISLSPNSSMVGNPAFNLTVTGANFVSGSTVYWNGVPLSTAFVSTTQLTALIPEIAIATVGTADVTVTNPGSGGYNALGFAVNPVPLTISSLTPNEATAGGPAFTLVVSGTGFVPGTAVIWNGTALSTSFVSGTQVTAAVPAILIQNAGDGDVNVLNPDGTPAIRPTNFSIFAQNLNFSAAPRIPHIADGAGWTTTFVIENLDAVPVDYTFSFWGDNGSALPIELLFNGRGPVPLSGTLPVGQTYFASSPGISSTLLQGWAEVPSSGKVGVMALFKYSAPGVPDSQGGVIGTTPASTISMPYDNTQGYIMGVALANSNPTQALTVGLTFETDQGTQTSGQLTLPAHGHTAFVLANNFPATAGTRGSIHFTAASPDLTVLGERFTPSLSFTTTGTFQPNPTDSAVGAPQNLSFANALRIPHIADGAGWTTTFVIENLDVVPVNYAFNFWSDNGTALPIQLVNKDGTPAASSGTLNVGATYFAQSPGVSQSLLEGWAEAASNGNVGVMALFKYTAPGVPDSQGSVIATTSAAAIDMPYDNTQGYIMGVALANTNPTQPLTIALTFETDQGTQTTGQLALPAHGHTAFVLANSFPATAGARGSIHFTTTSPDLTVLGERFTPSLSFTTLGTFQ